MQQVTNQKSTQELFTENSKLKKEYKKQKEEIYNLKNQMQTLSIDLKGVGRLIDLMHTIDEYTDKEANISAFNNLNRLVLDIASSLEASANIT